MGILGCLRVPRDRNHWNYLGNHRAAPRPPQFEQSPFRESSGTTQPHTWFQCQVQSSEILEWRQFEIVGFSDRVFVGERLVQTLIFLMRCFHMFPKPYSVNSSFYFITRSAANRVPLGPIVLYRVPVDPFHAEPRPDFF